MTTIERITGVRLYFLPITTRVPLKFGHETLTSVTCARVAIRIADETGREAVGWGETPLSVQWVWPGSLPYGTRHEALVRFMQLLAAAWMRFDGTGHPVVVGHAFQQQVLPDQLKDFNDAEAAAGRLTEPMPYLAALVCTSPFDIALHDAYGQLAGLPAYQAYGNEFLRKDLAAFVTPADGAGFSFGGRYPADFLVASPPLRLPAWHLVGGLDLLGSEELTGNEPQDGHPVVLTDWIQRDGLKCLKVKLRGNDAVWDYERMVRVGRIAIANQVLWLSADFNCTVREPAYVCEILDRLRDDEPRVYGMILYVEQPFPYELEQHPIDVHCVSARKPLFLDESAHDWKMVRLGRELGWSGVALKTCKTQTGALLSACWAKAHGMNLMVQDLTNPMLAQIPHVLLAAHTGTIMGVETNGMQFYPAASEPEQRVHPGVYQRRNGELDLATIRGHGFGYRLEEIERLLPEPAVSLGW
jgi:L-alanine-DL-glutamate epimerase-like enolase superfamily enzyme